MRIKQEEEFYGLEDFFKDLQEEFRSWEANSTSQGKPKSLWEELAEIGEEFVEFLEKELNMVDPEVDSSSSAQIFELQRWFHWDQLVSSYITI
ncbi:hypothetical protein K1719_004654 [Acacia pycnantha]|nr:hypothetical protein K1719_004654 [Acacia pycnantha]